MSVLRFQLQLLTKFFYKVIMSPALFVVTSEDGVLSKQDKGLNLEIGVQKTGRLTAGVDL